MERIKVTSSIHIDYYDDLKAYIHSLPSKAQLRFLSATSYNCTFGDVVIVFREADDYVLIIPYIPSEFPEMVKRLDMPETREELAIRCVEKEAGLEVVSRPIAISLPKKVRNTHPELLGKPFFKHTMLITGTTGMLKRKEEMVSGKNLPPVWIQRKLLYRIFENEAQSNSKIHPQVYNYSKFMIHCALR